MMYSRLPTVFLALALFSGCEPNYNYAGYTMGDYFSLDGSKRNWEYASEEDDIEWILLVEKLGETRVDDDTIVTVEHSDDTAGDLLYEMKWASAPTRGIKLHSYEDLKSGEGAETFNPPVIMAESRMIPGESVVTQTGGYTWTATFEAVLSDGCPTYWANHWDQPCLQVSLSDGVEGGSDHPGVTGTYWLVASWAAAWLELDAYEGRRNLLKAKWDD